MSEMTEEAAKALRKPFDTKSVGKLPKPYKRDSVKGKCNECGGFHGLPAVHLDYVGHAATTDRLLAVDPNWTWEPMATDEHGLPIPDGQGNLWIRLTILGVTRPGVGDGASMKERIGDAIRNAAMRFGVALDLWSKEELESVEAGEVYKPPTTKPAVEAPADEPPPDDPGDLTPDPITPEQVKSLNTAASKLGLNRDQKIAGISATIGRDVESSKDLTKDEATKVIKSLNATLREREAEAVVTAELPIAGDQS